MVDICYPADPGANLPAGGLEGYDGVAITGSALNVHDGGPSIAPQIELAREVLKARTPLSEAAGACRSSPWRRAARCRRVAAALLFGSIVWNIWQATSWCCRALSITINGE